MLCNDSHLLKHGLRPIAGFTLAELLICLLILGEIATFTIPKLLNAQQISSDKAKAKEAAAMMAGAFQQAKLAGVITATSTPIDLTPYLNYLSLDTTSTIDTVPGFSSTSCSISEPCIRLHNGSALWLRNNNFAGTTTTNSVEFLFDPDMKQNTTSTANQPGKAIKFILFYDGLITTNGASARTTICSSFYCPYSPNPAYDPTWFSW